MDPRQPLSARHRPFFDVQRTLLVIGLCLVLALAGAVVYTGRRIAPHASLRTEVPPSVTATSQPVPGQRWFWQRSQWQQPEQPQP